MTDYIVSGATTPANCNGVYIPSVSSSNNVAYRHISKNFYIVTDSGINYIGNYPYIYDWTAQQAQGALDYFSKGGSIDGSYNAVSGVGTVVVNVYSGSPAGTTSTAILNTDYIDKAYMGADGVAVDVS